MNILEEIARGETYDLEFKLVPNQDRIKYQKTAVAFANGKGGRILFGVANDRTVIGIPKRQGVRGDGRDRQFHFGCLLSSHPGRCRN